jgi:hypothetical protein
MKCPDLAALSICLGLALAATLPLGCGPKATAADPEAARESLRAALDAWQKGETPESLRGRSPSITASDSQWQSGYRLLSYEIAGDGQPAGYDVQCHVLLRLQRPDGQQVQEKAVFTVSTHPARVVVRENG